MKIRWIFLISFCLLVMVVLLSKANYSSKEAIKNGDVVLTHNDSYNIDNFFDFLEKKRNSLRVVVYTDEGDPIITDLTYDQGDNIFFKIDNSEDRFSGSGGSKTGVCNNIIQQTNLNGIMYNLTGCSGFEDSIFLFLLKNEEQ